MGLMCLLSTETETELFYITRLTLHFLKVVHVYMESGVGVTREPSGPEACAFSCSPLGVRFLCGL